MHTFKLVYNQGERFAVVGNYIERSLEAVVRKAVLEFPAVVVTGPRQSGKRPIDTVNECGESERHDG